jgi:NAD(P)-dependent dehydrogenase (short-subunit alcohol dehydrogenase family)
VRAERARGRILTTGSIAGFSTIPGLGPYSMSKHAVEAMSDALRRELRPFGIEVSLLEPGSIATDIWGKASGSVSETREATPTGIMDLYGGLLAAMHDLTTGASSTDPGARRSYRGPTSVSGGGGGGVILSAASTAIRSFPGADCARMSATTARARPSRALDPVIGTMKSP